MVALDAAVDRVESVSLRHDELRAVRSLDRMIESSTQRRAHHSNDVDPNSILVIDGAASTKSYGSRLPKPFAAWDARTPSRNSHRSRLFQLLSVCFVALFGLAAYLVLQRPFVLSARRPHRRPNRLRPQVKRTLPWRHQPLSVDNRRA